MARTTYQQPPGDIQALMHVVRFCDHITSDAFFNRLRKMCL